MTVVGIQEKKGEYNGNAYHNYLIHCLKDDDNALGQVPETVKVKFASVKEVFGKVMSIADFDALIGCEIRAYYDKFGNATEVRVIESSEPAEKSAVKN